MSVTRWSARLQCTKPFDYHFNGNQLVLQNRLELKFAAKTRNEISEVLAYLNGIILCVCANVGRLV